MGGNAESSVLWVNDNRLLVFHGGTFPSFSPVNSPFIDIEVGSTPNNLIFRNFILPINKDSVFLRNRWAIHPHDGESAGNIMLDNQVIGNAGNNFDFGMCGFHFMDAGPWVVCENVSRNTLRGFHFRDDNEPSIIGLNSIGDHHSSAASGSGYTAGFLVDGNAQIGQQFCQHNHWTATYNDPDWGAENRNTGTALQKFSVIK